MSGVVGNEEEESYISRFGTKGPGLSTHEVLTSVPISEF